MILRCATPTCVSPFQDNRYGFGHRVANPQKKLSEYARCTVCKTSIRISGIMQTVAKEEAKDKKKKK